MKKTQVALLCVVFFGAGAVVGFAGRGCIVPCVVPSEEQQLEKPSTKEEAEMQAMITGIPVGASQEFVAAKDLVNDMRNLKAALLVFYAGNMGEKVELEKTLDTPEHIKDVLGKLVPNIEKYLDGNWIFHGNTGAWWIGYNLEAGFKDQSSEIGKELMERAEKRGLCKDTDGNLYDGGSTVYMLVRDPKN